MREVAILRLAIYRHVILPANYILGNIQVMRLIRGLISRQVSPRLYNHIITITIRACV
jgi:hypothetical protein